MRTLATEGRDLSQQFAVAVDDAAVRQRLAERLRLWLGDWYLDTALGLPYLDDILQGDEYVSVARNIIRSAAGEVQGVAQVDNVTVSLDREKRRASIVVTVTTEYEGQVTAAV